MKNLEARAAEILLVEDSPSDTELTVEALRDAKVRNHLSIVEDGVQALSFSAARVLTPRRPGRT